MIEYIMLHALSAVIAEGIMNLFVELVIRFDWFVSFTTRQCVGGSDGQINWIRRSIKRCIAVTSSRRNAARRAGGRRKYHEIFFLLFDSVSHRLWPARVLKVFLAENWELKKSPIIFGVFSFDFYRIRSLQKYYWIRCSFFCSSSIARFRS